MNLEKNNPDVLSVKSLVDTYNMPVFAIGMIKDTYNITNPFVIAKKLTEIFNIDDLSIEEIIILSHHENNPKVGEFTTNMKSIF